MPKTPPADMPWFVSIVADEIGQSGGRRGGGAGERKRCGGGGERRRCGGGGGERRRCGGGERRRCGGGGGGGERRRCGGGGGERRRCGGGGSTRQLKSLEPACSAVRAIGARWTRSKLGSLAAVVAFAILTERARIGAQKAVCIQSAVSQALRRRFDARAAKIAYSVAFGREVH